MTCCAASMFGVRPVARDRCVGERRRQLSAGPLLETLRAFTGPDHEQEDDITLVTLRRSAGVAGRRTRGTSMGAPPW
jgi:hypothetical protein